MQRKIISLVTMIALCLLLIGCNRGCTTSRTIASESTIISTSGGDVELTGRVIDYRHSKRQSQYLLDRKVSHSYGLSFDIQFGTFIRKEFFHEGVKDPEKVNLPKELLRAKVAVSKDQNHIGLGVDGKVVELIHLYKSNRIRTNEPKLLADGTMDWSKLDINSYPSPASILTESLKNDCGTMLSEKDAMFAFCDASKPSAKIHRVMLDQWPSCNLAKKYLNEEKVQELSKSKKWRKYAEKRGKQVLKNVNSYGFEFDEVMQFTTALNSDKLNSILDSMLIEKWGRKGMSDYTQTLVSRISQKKNPLDKASQRKVYDEAKAEFAKFQRTGESNYAREASKCLQVLSALGDTMTGFEFIQSSFGANISRFKPYDFIEVAYQDLSVYTDYQQQLIIQKTEASFAYVKDYSRSSFYGAIDDLVDCSMLKRLKKKYPKDLERREVPGRCGP